LLRIAAGPNQKSAAAYLPVEDIDMRRFGAIILIIAAPVLFAGDKSAKGEKNKDKRFEAVTVSAAGVSGSYRGPSESYGLVLEAATDGTLRGNYVEQGRVAVLNAIVITGSDFTARASFDDGSSRLIRGSFATRVLNGNSAFGLRLHEIPVDAFGRVDTFFERL
jgi:hypothetical protein